MRDFKFSKMVLFACPLLFSTTVFAGEADVAQLEGRVAQKVDSIEQSGLLPTYVEVEQITVGVVAQEVQNTDLTVNEAIKKYQLVPTLSRSLRIRVALAAAIGPGEIEFPPPKPPG
jgi:hypothetical protein